MISKLEKEVIDITYEKGLSHLSSNLTAVKLIDNIFLSKKDNEPFVLSNGHAGLALYVILQKAYGLNARDLYDKHGVHPTKDEANHIDCTSGSLGQGLPIAVGMALADRSTPVWCLTSDGDMNEGSNWEALRIAGDQRIENLRLVCNANGTSAYGKTDTDMLDTRMQMFYPSLVVKTNMFRFPDWCQGIDGHYVVMDEPKYKEILNA